MTGRELPWDHLESCSDISLEDFMLLRQNVAANLRKSLMIEMEQLVDSLVDAQIAWLLLNRRTLLANLAETRQKLLKFEPEVMLPKRLKGAK